MNNKLILGTSQFGLNYGINNSSGQPSEKKVFEILDAASEQNIDSLDTADSYGNSIELISLFHGKRKYRFKVLSKFKKVKKGKLFDHTLNLLYKLNITYFEVYSFHSFTEYLNYSYLKDELLSLKSKGLIKKIGISVYTNPELQRVILDKDIDVIQVPYNLLDNQNIRGSFLDQAKEYNKEIHTRSVYLQGLIFMDERSIPEKLLPLKSYIKKIKSYCKSESISLQSLALGYAVYNKNIDRVLIGVDNTEQLLKNVESVSNLKNSFDFINRYIDVKETELLNPVNWK